MKKTVLFAALGCITTSCFAAGVYLDVPTCASVQGENLGGCIQNTTGVDIGSQALMLVANTKFANGRSETVLSTLSQFRQNHYINISWSDAALKYHHVDSIDFSITDKGQVVPGCFVRVAYSVPKQNNIVLMKSGNKLHC